LPKLARVAYIPPHPHILRLREQMNESFNTTIGIVQRRRIAQQRQEDPDAPISAPLPAPNVDWPAPEADAAGNGAAGEGGGGAGGDAGGAGGEAGADGGDGGFGGADDDAGGGDAGAGDAGDGGAGGAGGGGGAGRPDPTLAALSARVRPMQLTTLTGYVGPGDDPDWLRLYEDETLNTFLIIRREDVVNHERRYKEDAAQLTIDVIWLSQGVQLARGRRQPRPNVDEARFIIGDFLTAGDVAGAALAARRSGAGALFGDAGSPTCCRPSSSTYPPR